MHNIPIFNEKMKIKEKGTNSENHRSSLRVPLIDEILNLLDDFLKIVDYFQTAPQILKLIESL